jgi:hypothetical protein
MKLLLTVLAFACVTACHGKDKPAVVDPQPSQTPVVVETPKPPVMTIKCDVALEGSELFADLASLQAAGIEANRKALHGTICILLDGVKVKGVDGFGPCLGCHSL